MGSLKDIVAQEKVIGTAGGDFTVGPLTAADILGIYVTHRSGIEAIFASYRGGQDADSLFADLVVAFPDIAAEIIARGAREPDDAGVAAARSLDVGAQLVALETIGGLTVASVGGLGNLAALVERLARGVTGTMTLRNPTRSPSGSTDSASSVPPFSPEDTPTPGTTPSG